MTTEENIYRCPWVDLTKPDYVSYHDNEWGVPIHVDRTIFEFLTLESAQAGLSWYTILRKRGNYRIAFENFDPEKIAQFGDKKLNQLLSNPGIIRNRAKILATINNAQRFLEVQNEFGSFGIIFTRNKPPKNVFKNTIDLWSGQRKIILIMHDEDLKLMCQVYENKQRKPIDVINKKYVEFIRSCPS